MIQHHMRIFDDSDAPEEFKRIGVQHIERYDNGYGASYVSWISKRRSSYGGEDNLWELAIVKFNSNDIWDFKIVYNTPITTDIFGWLTIRQVEEILKKIEALPEI